MDGACYSWDESTQKVMDEIERIKIIIARNSDKFLSEEKLQGEFSPNGVMIQ